MHALECMHVYAKVIHSFGSVSQYEVVCKVCVNVVITYKQQYAQIRFIWKICFFTLLQKYLDRYIHGYYILTRK